MSGLKPVFLFTDFSWSGPYVGQMAAAVLAHEPKIPLVHLMHDAPRMRPDLAAYLLPACCRRLPDDVVIVAVVDPGVGSARDALIVETGTLTLVGPDNGLLALMPDIRRVRRIHWRPAVLSSSFHGRDLFAPVAARLASGDVPDSGATDPASMIGADWPKASDAIIYVDGFGNAMTGLSAEDLPRHRSLRLRGQQIGFAETFSSVAPGELFWYVNSQGLVEIAANQASAAALLGLAPGGRVLLD